MQFVYFLATAFALFGVSFGAVTFSSGTAVTIDENIAAGTTVMTAAATSATGPVTFAMTQTPADLFAIVPATGVVTVASGQTIDAETSTSSTLTIVGTDADGTPNKAESTVTITVTDLNDNTPTFGATTTATLAASAAAGTTIGTFAATDTDATTANNVRTYSLENCANIGVVATTGVVTTTTSGPSEAKCYRFLITATDSGTPALSATASVTVTVGGSTTCTSSSTYEELCEAGSASLTFSLMAMMLGLLTNLMK